MNSQFPVLKVLPEVLNQLVLFVMLQTKENDPNKAINKILHNSGEWQLQQIKQWWQDEGDIVNLTVTSDGTDGWSWIKRLEDLGIYVNSDAKKILTGKYFSVSSGVTSSIKIYKGSVLQDGDRTSENLRSLALSCGFMLPSFEIACLLIEKLKKFEVDSMNLSQICIGQSLKNSEILSIRSTSASLILAGYFDKVKLRRPTKHGFAFVSY